MKDKENKTLKYQMIMSFILIIAGAALLFLGMFTLPLGVIHNSVLIVFGQILTFVGSLFGINFNYQSKIKKLSQELKEDERNREG